jgi:hypothetical protein
MNRIALLFLFLSLAAGAQQPAPDAPPAPSPAPEVRPEEADDDDDDASPGAEERNEARDDDDDEDDDEDSRAGERHGRKKKSKEPECPEDYTEDEDSREASVLAPLQLDVEGRKLSPGSIELHGLKVLPEAQVRAFVGAPAVEEQRTLTPEDAQLILQRLARTDLFARVEPRVRVPEQGPVVLELHLEEHPTLTAVRFEGLQDIQADELLKELLRLPHAFPDEDEDEDEHVVATLRLDSRRGTLSVVRPCPPPRPPREWLARLEDGTLRPGIVLGGVARALERTLEEARDDGYLLASLSAVLSPDGVLVVTVDEGRLESVEVEGVDEAMAARVREALALKPGDVFLRSDAKRAMKRVESRLPFLRAADVDDEDGLRVRQARIIEEREADGTRRYRAQEEERKPKHRREHVELELGWHGALKWWDGLNEGEGLTLDGRRLVVHVRARRPDLDVDLLPVHTQVTGFAPGLSGRVRIWDPKDRIHATLDGAFFVPLRLGGQRLPDDAEGTRRQRRVNLLGGAKVQVPAVRLAELGLQAHDFTDTNDRWRLSDIDSYVYSFLLNRPDREYFRRKGLTAFATWRWADAWLAGAEYRADRYESLRSFTPPLSLFRRDSPPFPNAPVAEGRFESVVVRLEYASDAPPSAQVGSLFRTPETSLFHRDDDWDTRGSLRGLLTLEVGDGPGADARFWKLVGDLALAVPTGRDTGVRLRLRAAGGNELPEQKREALGGWSALRGVGFKELRGDASLLASAEYRWEALGVFADLGSVRAEEDWTDARLGLGASLHFSEDVRLDVAWRTDEKATATPEARLLFVRTF